MRLLDPNNNHCTAQNKTKKVFARLLEQQIAPSLDNSELTGITDSTQYMTGTFVYIKLGYLQNLMKNKCSMKCL